MFPEFFSLKELTDSDTAVKLGISNIPNAAQLLNLEWGANNILMPIRILLGGPITITSGFRASGVNVRDHGVAHSQHMDGRAADIFPEGWSLRNASDKIRNSEIPFDQLILESMCIHVSWVTSGEPRRESLRRLGMYPNWRYEPVMSFLK